MALAQAAQAAQFTPRVTVTLGFSDNVRMEHVPRGDSYLTVGPGVNYKVTDHANLFELDAQSNFSYYYRLTQFSGWEGGHLIAHWLRKPTQTFQYDLRLEARSTYEYLDNDQTGQLVRLRGSNQRRDSLLFSAGFDHRIAKNSRWYATYRVANIEYDGDRPGSTNHDVTVGTSLRVAPLWRFDAEAITYRDIYEEAPNDDRYRLDLTLARLVRDRGEYYVGAGYEIDRSHSNDPDVRNTEDYNLVRARVGAKWRVSPTFRYTAEVGWAKVSGDEANPNTNDGSFTYSMGLFWTQKRWRLALTANKDFTNYSALGQNSQPVEATRFSLIYNRQLARHWQITITGDYLTDDYNDNQTGATTGQSSDSQTVRVGARVDWKYTDDLSFALDYRFAEVNSDSDTLEERQNQLLLIMEAKWPKRW